MVRSFRFALIAVALLILAEAATLLVATPVEAIPLPPVESLRVPGWTPGQVQVNSQAPSVRRFIQDYTSPTTGQYAQIETRCSSDPKDFLKWTGVLGPEGAGYELLHSSTAHFPVAVSPSDRAQTMNALASVAVMHNASQKLVVLYAYLDHWGIHAWSNALYPRAIVDLVTRHRPPYCSLGVTIFNVAQEQRAVAEARGIAQTFLPVVDQQVRD